MKNKNKILLICLLITLLILSICINFYLFKNRQINNCQEKEILLEENIADLKNRIKYLDGNLKDIETYISKIASNIDSCNEAIVKLQNQTKEGKDNNIKIIINLLEIRDYSIIGKNFSETLNIVENMTKNNNELHAIVLKIYDHKNYIITNNEIIKSFLMELSSIKITEKNEKSIKYFIKSNIRLTKSRNSDNMILITEKFKELMNRNEYKKALDLLNLNKSINSFENTIQLLSRKSELELLIKEAFNIIYNQN